MNKIESNLLIEWRLVLEDHGVYSETMLPNDTAACMDGLDVERSKLNNAKDKNLYTKKTKFIAQIFEWLKAQ